MLHSFQSKHTLYSSFFYHHYDFLNLYHHHHYYSFFQVFIWVILGVILLSLLHFDCLKWFRGSVYFIFLITILSLFFLTFSLVFMYVMFFRFGNIHTNFLQISYFFILKYLHHHYYHHPHHFLHFNHHHYHHHNHYHHHYNFIHLHHHHYHNHNHYHYCYHFRHLHHHHYQIHFHYHHYHPHHHYQIHFYYHLLHLHHHHQLHHHHHHLLHQGLISLIWPATVSFSKFPSGNFFQSYLWFSFILVLWSDFKVLYTLILHPYSILMGLLPFPKF